MDAHRIRRILDERTSINSETGCWEYLGTNADGYGQITIDRVFYYTHQLSAMLYLAYTPSADLIVCHLPICKSKACWNPLHLYIGTYVDNAQDMMKAGNAKGRYSDVTHCVNGHEFTPENTYVTKHDKTGRDRRQCKECRKIRDQETKAKRRANISDMVNWHNSQSKPS